MTDDERSQVAPDKIGAQFGIPRTGAPILNPSPRPRIVFAGAFSESDLPGLIGLCPTWYTEDDQFAYTEVDLIVGLNEHSFPSPKTIHVLQFGPDSSDTQEQEVIRCDHDDHFEPAISDLVDTLKRSALPIEFPKPARNLQVVKPFAWVGRNVVAGLYVGPHKCHHLVVPSYVNHRLWLRGFLAFLNDVDPRSAPNPPPTLSTPADWYTIRESQLASEILEISAKLERLGSQLEEKRAELVDASEEADRNERALLSDDGDDLVDACSRLLETLNFEVTDVDASLPEGEPKREDLLVRAGRESVWEALVEVKGYKNGAKTNDLTGINRHRIGYGTRNGKSPDGTWWIVNQFRHTDPSSRAALSDHVHDEATKFDTTAIDSRDLYRLAHRVAAGTISAKAARDALINAEAGLWRPDLDD